jgi:hypothetical protein
MVESVAKNMFETAAWNIVKTMARNMVDTSDGTGPLLLALPYSPPHRSFPIYMKCCAHRSV